jgi:sortase A
VFNTENGSLEGNMEDKGKDNNDLPEEQDELPEKKPRKKGKALIITGITLILIGLLTLVSIYTYIFYTNQKERNSQEELFRQWDDHPVSSESGEVSIGDGIARIIIPLINIDAIVVELWGLDDVENLKKGPGHIPDTAYPGQPGNMVISGHRTTYGAPFRHIEELTTGSEIILVTAENRYTYEVYAQRIVAPTDLTVLEQDGDPKLTLTACHPWYSAAQRIVVIAKLVSAEPL